MTNSGTRLYVADAIERREFAFEIGDGERPDRRVTVDAETRRNAAAVIRGTVEAIARAYRLPVQR